MADKLIEITDSAWEALEAEDKSIRSAVSKNKEFHPAEIGGILMIDNERHYQFLIAKYMFKKLKCRVKLEENYHDLTLEYPAEGNYTIEMKRWMTSTGNPEIRKIKQDVIHKLQNSNSQNVLMVFSANPQGTTENNLKQLEIKLVDSGIPDFGTYKRQYRSFCTYNRNNQLVEFWIATYLIPSIIIHEKS